MPRLLGKTTLVTGAARGIGAAIARAFSTEAAHVIVTDIDVEAGEATASAIGGTFARLDVASEADWTEIARLFPAMDVVVNNAGITGFEGPHEGVPPSHDPETHGLTIGAPCTPSTSMVHSLAVAMPSAPCGPKVEAPSSTSHLDRD